VAPKRIDKGEPIVAFVGGRHFIVGRDDGTQVIPEGDFHRRNIVERAQAQFQDPLRGA
jgi:hypothetical protein